MKIKFCVGFMLLIFVNVFASDSEFMKYMNQQMGEFKNFKEERDREFTDFLKNEWKDYQMFQGLKADEKPKPKTIPKVKIEKPIIVEEAKPEVVIPKIIEQPKLPKMLEIKIVPTKTTPMQNKASITFNFYGINISIDYDKDMIFDKLERVNNENIADFWEKTSKSDFNIVLDSVKFSIKKLKLKDWGTVVFVRNVSKNIYGDFNRSNLLSWFILAKLGFDAKVGIQSDKIYLLLPSDKKMFGVTYFNLENKKYYAVDTFETKKFIKSIRTYDGNYPGSKNLVSINIELPEFPPEYSEKVFQFGYQGKTYTLRLEYDKNFVDFYKLFPQTELRVFANSEASAEAKFKLVSQLSKIVERKPVVEAANIILRFVQTAFAYKTDIDQFGYEKYFVPDETIFYPYSDCEDRAILYQYLIKNILGLDIVLLDYPGHVATAINFDSDIKGDYLVKDGKRYYIADPTYINANIGMTMPNVAKYKPKIIN